MPMQAIDDLGGAVEELIIHGVPAVRAREIVGSAFLAGVNAAKVRNREPVAFPVFQRKPKLPQLD